MQEGEEMSVWQEGQVESAKQGEIADGTVCWWRANAHLQYEVWSVNETFKK